jgi:protein MpaA
MLPHGTKTPPTRLQILQTQAIRLALRAQEVVTTKRFLVGSGVTAAALVLGFTAFSLWPRTVSFSYAQPTCVTQPLLFPNLNSTRTSGDFEATAKPSLSLGGLALYSHKTCVSPVEAPKAHQTETVVFGTALFKKSIRVKAGTLPALMNKAPLEKPVAVKEPLVFNLENSDRVFAYRLVVNDDHELPCDSQGRAINCNISELGLAQSGAYKVSLERTFEGKPAGKVVEQIVTTVEAIHVTVSSLAANQMVYDQPTEATLTFNKNASAFKNVRLEWLTGEGIKQIKITPELNGNNLKVRFNEALPRSSTFELIVEEVTADDGGYLPTTYVLPFTTSGGPKVLGVNIGHSKVQPSVSVVISFDSPVSSQNVSDYIKLEGGGSTGASISVQGNKVTIKPGTALSRCSPFTVKVLDGLKNDYGISGGSAWSFKSRVICQTVFSIGNSVQGRSILAYRFGTGASKIIYVGGTHGDEKSSVSTLNSFIDALETNPERIPGHRTIIVIPNLNPDGYAASRRTNANNVDLNRNFPANNWKQGVTTPGGTYNPNGGGSAPLSEPESSALASYVLGQDPRLVLTYHAAAGVVIPNDSGDSDALAHVYDQKSNVGYEPNSSTGSIFAYDTTGAFEDWLHDKHGIATILVELWTKGSNEYSKNQNAMWHMVELP